MSSPDDARFRPGDPTPDDYDVGDGYETASAPGYAAPTPYGAIDVPSETPVPRATTPGTTARPRPRQLQRPTEPQGFNPRAGSTRRRRSAGSVFRRRSAGSVIALGAVALVLVTMVVGSIVSRLSGDDGTSPWTAGGGGSNPPNLEYTWTFSLDELSEAPADASLSSHPDGAFTGLRVIDGPDAWVVTWADDDFVPGGVAAVDPATGSPLWDRALPEVLCADRQVEGTLLCVAREGDTWTYHRIDAVTGEDLVTADLTIAEVQTVHSNGEVLIAVGPANPAPHADVVGIALDGIELWDFDVATLEGADLLFTSVYDSNGQPILERPRWRDLDGGLVMLWSTPGVAIIDPSTGDTFVHECRAATPVGDHYFCWVQENLHRYGLDGTLAWSAPGLRPATPEDASDARLVALREPDPNAFDVVQVDPESGEVGELVYSFVQTPGTWTNLVIPPSVNAEPDATFLVGDQMIVALDPETGGLLWSTPHDFIYAGDIIQIGDVAVLNADDLTGYDIATGELLWQRNASGEPWLLDADQLVMTVGFDELRLVALPS